MRRGAYARLAAEALAADDPACATVLAAHSSYYAERATKLGPRADRELENLLRAHETAVRLATQNRELGRAEDAVKIAVGLEPLLSVRGLSRLRARLFANTLEALDVTESPHSEAKARAHLGRGLAFRELGETARARDDFERALTLAETARDDGLSAVALTQLGGVYDVAGDTAGARERLARALALLGGAGRCVAKCQTGRGGLKQPIRQQLQEHLEARPRAVVHVAVKSGPELVSALDWRRPDDLARHEDALGLAVREDRPDLKLNQGPRLDRLVGVDADARKRDVRRLTFDRVTIRKDHASAEITGEALVGTTLVHTGTLSLVGSITQISGCGLWAGEVEAGESREQPFDLAQAHARRDRVGQIRGRRELALE